MRKRSPQKRTGDEPPSEAPAVHGYRTVKKGSLKLDDERRLGRTIQEGNVALSELGEAIVQAIKTHLNAVEVAPVKPTTLSALVTKAVGEVLIRCAQSKQAGRTELVGREIHRALADLLAAEDVLEGQDAQGWLTERLAQLAVSQAISPTLLAADGQFDLISRRERAIGELVEWHLPLAKPIARSAMRQPFEFDDMMNESALILRHVAERFDPDSGNRFSSYAKVALKRDLWRRSPTSIGLTRHSRDQVEEVRKLEQKLAHEQGHSVTMEEVYERLACPDRTRAEIENVRRILKARRQPHPHSAQALADLRDLQLPDPFQVVSEKETSQRLRAAFRRLSRLERRVVVGRCVLALSFRRLAKRLKKSPNTLRDICIESLQKMADYLDPNRPLRKPK
ncbi:MAG: sigma-70 family RNA polymerase sigma factor [Pirellulales bacterium]|nr:sigma-70 family RNA polymerase sigma factor [Pirellulales bacterium]